MKRTIVPLCILAVALTLLFSMKASAQGPYILKGNQELGVSGTLDFEGPTGGVDIQLQLSYGYFIRDHLEVGGFGNFSRELDGDVMRYGIGAFAEQHFPALLTAWPSVIPYLGASLGLQFVDVDFTEDESALIFVPRVGVKWFLRDHFAIDTNLFLALATDDVYVNDEDLDAYDVGINLGLRVYF